MNDVSSKCPECGSAEIRFRFKRKDWFCDACDHRWTVDAAGTPEEDISVDAPAKLFLSYARGDDEPFARRLYGDLNARGFRVWFDRISMPSRQLTFHQEIRDAVADCDRLVLVVGPKAVTSDYVQQEWRFAYFEVDKCVNPIVRLDDVSSSREKIDGYELIPEDLKLLHAEDFRDDARYTEHLENLVRQLSEPPPRVGKLVAVPRLPPHFCEHRDRIATLRDLLLVDLRKPVVVSGAAARVGVQGMGGIGKSVLACALARRPEIRRAFTDGVFWVALGQNPDLAALQRKLATELGDEALFDNAGQGKERLCKLFENRAALLVLDDVWQRPHAEAFNAVGPRGRILITTRDTGLVTALAAKENHYQVQLPTLAEAQDLLAAAAEVEIADLPPAAGQVIDQCGRLPLAMTLCGGMIAGGSRWDDLLDALGEHDLEYLSTDHPPEEQHESIWRAMNVSVLALAEEQRDRFAELAVFAIDRGAPEIVIETLWGHTAGFNARQSRKLLVEFTRRSLITTTRGPQADDQSPSQITLHDLLHNFATGMAEKRFGSLRAMHVRLLNAYSEKCSADWASGPNDGYFFENLRDHLVSSGQADQLVDLLQDLRWLEGKNEAGLTFDLPADYSAALEAVDLDHPRRHILRLLDEAVRRDIHFIARHAEDYPQGLFQCLWNTCWWYDCAAAAAHYVEPEGGWTENNVPWKRPVWEKLCTLLERWRETREQSAGRFRWLRSRRPPPIPLDKALVAVLRGHAFEVTSVSCSSDGQWIVSGSGDRTVRVWDARSSAELAVLYGHARGVTSVSCSPDARRIASGSKDNTVRVWDAESGSELIVLRGHEGVVTSVSYSPDGRQIASGSWDRTIRVWDAESGAELIVLRGHKGEVTSVSYSPDARWIASGSSDTTVRVWDAISGAELAVLRGHGGSVNSVSYNCDGQSIVSGSSDKIVKIWNAESGVELAVLRGHENSVTSVSCSPDALRIASGSIDTTVRVWDAKSGAELAIFRGHPSLVRSVSYSPDGLRIISGSWDYTACVWNVTQSIGLPVLRGHVSQVRSISCSPDGRRIASGSNDNTIRIWDVNSGTELAILHGHMSQVFDVSYSPDGQHIFSRSPDDDRIWNAATLECVEVLPFGGLRDVVSSGNWPESVWYVGRQDLETVIEGTGSGRPVARFPAELYPATSHLMGRSCAGAMGNQVYVFTLEGDDATQ